MMVENRGPQVAGVAAAFLSMCWIAIGLRVYCRLAIVKSFGIDDYLAVASMLMFTCFCAFCITGVHYGTGQHTVDINPPSNLILGLKSWWFCEPFYVISNLTLKFSIGIFLLRIAVAKTQKYVLMTIIVVQAVYSTYYFFLFVFQCLPVQHFWLQWAGEKGTCLNTNLIVDSTYAYAAVCCVTDWTFGLLPVWMIWDLQMNSKTKITVGVILAFAAIGSTATIVRMPYIKGLRDTSDFLWATTDVAIWSTAETGIGIMASAIATLRPLFRNLLGRNNFLGAASSGGTRKWTTKIGPSSNGYVKSTSQSGNADLGLRSDIGHTGGITTTIRGSPFDEAEDMEMGNTSRARRDSQNQLRPPNGWGVQDKLADDSSDEYALTPPQTDWGIRKTMVVSTTKSEC